MIEENTFVEFKRHHYREGDAYQEYARQAEEGFKDASTMLKNNESGYIDKVYTNCNGDGHHFCKVRIRSDTHPQYRR